MTLNDRNTQLYPI